MTTLMMQSIVEQPEAVRRVLERDIGADALATAFRARDIRKVWIVGSGTSHFAAMIAARSWRTDLAIDCQAVSSLEFLDDAVARDIGRETMLLAISQSGASLVLLEGVRRANAAGALTAVITAEPHAPIPGEAGFTIETHTGREENLGKCKGFTTTALAAVLLGRLIAAGNHVDERATVAEQHRQLPQMFAEAIAASRAAAAKWAERFRESVALYVVGAGALVATAEEGALKVLEVAKLPVVVKELEEMMHGPFNGVGGNTGIILIADDTARQDRLAAFTAGTRLVGSPFLAIAGSTPADPAAFEFALPECADPVLRAILAVVPFQLLAHELAAARSAAIDTARYPQLYPIFASKSVHR